MHAMETDSGFAGVAKNWERCEKFNEEWRSYGHIVYYPETIVEIL